MPRRDQLFETVTTEGALLPSDFLQRLAQRDPEIKGLTPDEYHLGGGEKINEAISRSWNRVLGVWQSFSAAAQALPANDLGTTLTRDKWLRPLFQELGYGWLATAKPFEFDDRKYAISHGWQATPIHLVSFRANLDERSEAIAGARRSTPHSMVQEFLNRSDAHLWGIVGNGYRLRLLRDNASLTRQAYVDFDLQSMMQGEVYADFALLWLLLHQSRVEGERPELCWLEKWTQEARQQGERVLDHMRIGVQDAITALGQGFLAHPANTSLRQLLRDGQLPTLEYYKQLLRVVYRFIFLLIAEDRDLLHVPVKDDAPKGEREKATKAREAYFRHYSLTRIRRMAQRLGGTQHSDLWQIVRLIVSSLGSKDGCPSLGLPALGSFLWSARATPALNDCQISNRYLLQAIRSLAITQQGRFRRPVDYKNIGSAEFGSVYESLLEQHPKINLDAAKFELGTHAGNERKTTGSHWTPPPLVNCLLDSALEPVIAERLKDAEHIANGEWRTATGEWKPASKSWLDAKHRAYVWRVLQKLPATAAPADFTPEAVEALWQATPYHTRYLLFAEDALLSIKVCDKAVGSGHFLIGAGHRIAKRLASIRTGEAEPPPAAVRHALRDVIGRCLYGVDINPMAVELCKFALWLEALEPGKPLSFLDHHIQCGNSLLGATPALMAQGIPDAAFEPIEGDDKKYCSQFKKANREEATQLQLLTASDKPWEHLGNLATNIAQIASLPDDRLEDVQVKEQKYAELVHSTGYEFGRQLADAWCAAFVWKKCPPTAGGFDYPITNEIFRRLERNPHDAPKWMRDEIKRLAEHYQFFHWHLAFPDVFQVPPAGQKRENELCGWNGGFDVTLGNPPWEKINLRDDEFFLVSHPEIADAPTKAVRKQLIESLEQTDPPTYAAYLDAQRIHDAQSNFFRGSGAFPKTGVSRINLYSVFAELALACLAPTGRLGLVIASGIATDDNNKDLFAELVAASRLVSLWDFENRNGLFPDVDSRYKFCLFCAAGIKVAAKSADFAFFLHEVAQLAEVERHFVLSKDEFGLINPRTKTCPIFRSCRDAEIAKSIYSRVPALCRHKVTHNWPGTPKTAFNMANDSALFVLAATLRNQGFDLAGNCFSGDGLYFLPLYEAKMVWHFDHRWSSFKDDESHDFETHEKLDCCRSAQPRYWLPKGEVDSRFADWKHGWQLGYRRVTCSTNERTAVVSMFPYAGVGHTITLIRDISARNAALFVANASSFVFDYTCRQKVSGADLTITVFEQLPILPPESYALPQPEFILPRVLELTYTAWDLEPFARDCGYEGPPFRWDEARRFLLRCELDAAFFHLYGISRDDTAYILDTFPIVKRKDIAAHGTYRTQETILHVYDALAEAQRTGQPYQTLLTPPPADLAVAHPPKS
jgi:hypothetical protein